MADQANEPPVLASLAAPKELAPLFVGVCAAAMLFEGLVAGGEAFVYAGLVFLVPAITAGFVAAAAARAQWRRVFHSAAVGAGAQGTIGLAIAMLVGGPRIDTFLIVLVVAAVTVAAATMVALPLIVAAGVIAGRKDLAAGDAMLAAGGVWLVVAQLVKMMLMPDLALGFVPALALGGLAIGIRVARGVARRSWANRVARGEVQGWRVRTFASDHEIAVLPPLFPASPNPGGVPAILERVVVGGALYRSGLVGEPVATVQTPASISP